MFTIKYSISKNINFFKIIFSLLLIYSCSSDPVVEDPVVEYFTLTLGSGDGGDVSSVGGVYESGESVSITATSNSENAFTGWSNGSTDNPLQITLNQNITISPIFEPAFSVSDEFESLLFTLELGTVVDGKILTSSINTITELDLSETNTEVNNGPLINIDGIENFSNLRKLICDRQSLRQVDLSQNNNLEYVQLQNNNLSSINISNLTYLEKLYLTGNNLGTISIEENTLLTWLTVGQNFLSSIDLSENNRLNYLSIKQNPLESIDLSNQVMITNLFLNETLLSSLDVSMINNLNELDVLQNSTLTCVKVSQSQLDNKVLNWNNDLTLSFNLDCQ
jgi:ABC-type cobalt transport system substrate-binding protein|tara:strand:- start:152 stop:1159 length:1008 start_codon:yes stop_codon:yes gene_type:complete